MNRLILSFLTVSLLTFSCKKDKKNNDNTPQKPSGPGYTVPTTYNFTNVNYSGQTTRLDMLAEMKAYMNTGNTTGNVVLASKLKDMYANVNSPFANNALNTSGKDIKSKVFSLDQNLFEKFMDSLQIASQSTVAGSNGVSGVVASNTEPGKNYLCDKNGIEWAQIIEKGLMGALIYYQSTAVYLSESKIGNSVDNTSVTPGQGTAMEHHWDEAFGYFGVPVDFPSNTNGVRFWGKYCNDRNPLMGCNATIMNAFIKGRAAISNKDYPTRDQQVPIIRDNWEKVIAATIISYVNKTKQKMTDDAIRNHNCSEIMAFIMNFKYNPTKKITDAQINQLKTYLGYNFYNITTTQLDNIKNLLSSIYGLDSIKDQL
ncbi:MAG: DUF4856 domain-containing protein [Bacteroidia bacterium]|nr:DUF4856 domain-containing protein [Bacteroidia bacterium]